MKRKLNILQSALLLSAFFLSTALIAQDNLLELLPGSDRLEYDEKTGIHKLYGNVNFKYQSNLMYCDSAYYYQRREQVFAYGNVHINKRDTLNLFCDSLFYNGRTRQAKLWGNVRVRDNEYKLTTDTLDYDARAGQASYKHGGVVESILSRERLTSRVGYFHPESKNFYFSKDVTYKSNEMSMTTDTLRYLYANQTAYFYGPTDISTKDADLFCKSGWYNTRTEEGTLRHDARIERPGELIRGDTLEYRPTLQEYIGRGNVFYYDSTEQNFFTGDYAYRSDSLNYTLLTGDAIASRELSDDTLNLHADTIYYEEIDSVNLIRAYYNAKIYSTSFQSVADSIVYDQSLGKIECFHDPIVWAEGAELKGDYIVLNLEDTLLKTAEVDQNATVIMPVEKDELYNQIAGKKILAFFKDNELDQANVDGNAMTIAFPEDEEKEPEDTTLVIKRMGMNRLYASRLRIDVDSNEIVGVSYIDQPDGKFYPMDKIQKDEMFVPGFIDRSALRPKDREDLLND